MLTRSRLAELSTALEDRLALSVYVARENEDPGMGAAWAKRLDAALGDVHADVEARAPTDLPAFERAADRVRASMESFGRILPHEGWFAVATEDRLWLAESLPYRPHELVRWREGAVLAPAVRALKVGRRAVLAVLSGTHADVYQYEGDELLGPVELHAEWPAAEATDVGVSKRASHRSGVRGVTRTDFVKRARDENVRRHQKELVEAILERVGDQGVVVLGGTRKAVALVSEELEAELPGRIAEAPDLAFDATRRELVERVGQEATRLTEARQAALVETCADPHEGSTGWNGTYRALAAGAVAALLVARDLVERAPDDAERLVRLAIAQGAELEEVGGPLGHRLMAECDGIAARLRFVPASLKV